MSATGKTIAFLREVAIAAPQNFAVLAKQAEQLAIPSIKEAGECATALMIVSRQAVKQLQFATPQTQIHLRDAIGKLAEALMVELEAHGGDTLPYYVER